MTHLINQFKRSLILSFIIISMNLLSCGILNDTTIPTLQVLWPNGGEKLKVGQTYEIRWLSEQNDGSPMDGFLLIILEGKDSNPVQDCTFYITDHIDDVKKFEWTISDTCQGQFKVFVNNQSWEVYDESDDWFTIEN